MRLKYEAVAYPILGPRPLQWELSQHPHTCLCFPWLVCPIEDLDNHLARWATVNGGQSTRAQTHRATTGKGHLFGAMNGHEEQVGKVESGCTSRRYIETTKNIPGTHDAEEKNLSEEIELEGKREELRRV